MNVSLPKFMSFSAHSVESEKIIFAALTVVLYRARFMLVTMTCDKDIGILTTEVSKPLIAARECFSET